MSRAIARLAAAFALAVAWPGSAAAPAIFAAPTTDQRGVRAPLGDVLVGRVTILHFMYPSCQSFCPISGAVLGRTQQLLGNGDGASGYQIVSISIVPREATPTRLAAWLADHRAGPGWRALHIPPAALAQVMRAYGETAIDVQLHSSQMMVLDRGGRIVRRFDDLPEASALASAVRRATLRR